MVDFFGLPTDRRLSEMSKGMGEKLQISLIMSRRARVYLLDEPISGVDPATRDVILEGILREFDPRRCSSCPPTSSPTSNTSSTTRSS